MTVAPGHDGNVRDQAPSEACRPWVEVLASARPVPHYPKTLQARASYTAITRELYTFAYRGESTAVHSMAGLLGAHAASQPPFPPHLILHNVVVASFLVFAAAGNLLKDERCGAMARHLDEARKVKAQPEFSTSRE